MLTQDYTVRLDTFEGPLDLLLFLIRRAELDVSEISLAEIADQYLRHLEGIDRIDIEDAGEFLVTAATLIEIKSRAVAPPAQADQGDAPTTGDASLAMLVAQEKGERESESPAATLVRQLLQYKAYRDAADALERRKDEWEQRFPLGRAGLDKAALPEPSDADLGLDEIELYDLVQAFARIMETMSFDRIGAHEVTYDDTPIELHCADILDRLNREGTPENGLSFRRVFEGRTRGELVGMFIALLELVRQRKIAVSQDKTADEIILRVSTEPDPAEVVQTPGAE